MFYIEYIKKHKKHSSLETFRVEIYNEYNKMLTDTFLVKDKK